MKRNVKAGYFPFKCLLVLGYNWSEPGINETIVAGNGRAKGTRGYELSEMMIKFVNGFGRLGLI